MIRRATILQTLVFSAVFTGEASACSRLGEISNVAMVREANVIVRAIAQEYAVPPRAPEKLTGNSLYPTKRGSDTRRIVVPTIRFRVLETIRGTVGSEVILPGVLVDTDDFNDRPVPYALVRKSGGGSCFANSYRSGAQFLLLLKTTDAGELTANWYALGPVNEQLHADDDPWILWVRKQAQ
jgi:hypothetical protein